MKKTIIALALSALLLLTVGCSAAAPLKNESYAMEPMTPQEAPMPAPQASATGSSGWDARADTDQAWDMAVEAEESAVEGGSGVPDYDYGGHKIIKTASLGMETRQFDDTMAYIKQRVADYKGYISYSHVSGRTPENYNDPGRYASISLRLPQDKMEIFLADARGLSYATVTYESTGGQDITSSYFDTESRLGIYKTQQERILLLLEKAETMEDIIALESELSRLTYEIEALTTQLKQWDNLVDFSTVSIDLSEIPPNTPVASDDSMGTRISEGFARTLSGMAVFFENFLVFLLVASPVLVLLGGIAVLIIFLVRRKRKKRGTLAPKQSRKEKKHLKQSPQNTPDEHEAP